MTDPHPESQAAGLPPLTLADLESVNLSTLLADHIDASCTDLQPVFISAKDEYEGGAARILMLLANICSMVLVPEEPGIVFRPRVIWTNGTSMSPEHLTANDIEVLAMAVEKVNAPALRARLADLVWIRERKRGDRFPRMAINDYTSLLPAKSTWHSGSNACWHRALQLAKQISAREEVKEIEDACNFRN